MEKEIVVTEEGLKQGKEEGLKKGKEEGLKQGKEEGLKQGKIQIAKKLLKSKPDITIKQLMEITELSKGLTILAAIWTTAVVLPHPDLPIHITRLPSGIPAE